MSARNRARANPNQDADEERRLWKEIKDKAKDVDVMVVCSNPPLPSRLRSVSAHAIVLC